MVEEPAQRPWHRLRLVVVVEAGQLAPARVPAHLDQPRAELHPEHHPAQQPQDQHRRPHPRVAEEDREEAHLQQQRLPAEGVPGLPHVHDRQVQQPQQRPYPHGRAQRNEVPRPRGQGRGHPGPRPGAAGEEPVRVAQLEQARGVFERHVPHIVRHGQHAARPDQCPELQGGRDEGEEVDAGEGPLEDQPAQPVNGRREPVHPLQYRADQAAAASLRTVRPSHRA